MEVVNNSGKLCVAELEDGYDPEKKVLSDAEINGLQLQGKLAYLTGSSVEMTKNLLESINDPVELIDKDLHKSEAWDKTH